MTAAQWGQTIAATALLYVVALWCYEVACSVVGAFNRWFANMLQKLECNEAQ